jgi:sulfonate transport system ATP-binding protein
LLLDEPFSALDAITRSQLHKLIRDTRDLLGTTIVLVTHDISEALAIADRVVVLADKDRTLELRPETEKQTEQEAQILLALGGNYVI